MGRFFVLKIVLSVDTRRAGLEAKLVQEFWELMGVVLHASRGRLFVFNPIKGNFGLILEPQMIAVVWDPRVTLI